jgi:hypothetical protein
MRRSSLAVVLSIAIASSASGHAATAPQGPPSATAASVAPVGVPVAAPVPDASRLAAAAPRANPRVLALALQAADCARRHGQSSVARLAVIDYSLHSTRPRLWVFDLDRAALLFEELVAHGKGTGERFARYFSNVDGSKMSSLGLFRTGATYVGANGYSLRLEGLEPGFTDRAEPRAIVMHGASYVSRGLARELGRIGRSWGCPAVREEVARPVIDTLKGGSLLFAYYPDPRWLHESRYLSCPDAAPLTAAQAPGPIHRRTGS